MIGKKSELCIKMGDILAPCTTGALVLQPEKNM